MELAGKALQAASADPAAHSVVLLIDSPGGTVDGTETLSGQVLASRASGKPVVALASGAMNSAAYWIGSAAQAVYLAEPSTVMGSIGVVAQHVDVSGAQQKSGVTTTEIYAGQYKRIASQYAPLSDAGRVSIQNQVDFMYSIFVDAVARNRGVSSTEVLSNMADGRLFIGQQAIDAGLADGITSLADLVASLNVQHQSGQKGIPMRQIATQQARQPMTRADLHEAAKAYQLQHPGTDYLTAVKACDTQGLVSSMQSGGDAISQSYQPERVALHEAAKAYQLQHPGTDYLAAVRACEAVTAGR
jgi:signal peptide peptidase SppA